MFVGTSPYSNIFVTGSTNTVIIWAMFKREPARILAVLGAGLALAIGFGLKLSGEQVNLIMVFAAATIALLVGETTRSQVVPTQIADKQMEIAKASPVNRPTEEIIQQAKEESA